ncbi:tRNA-dihydrouridine synthase A [Thioclava dalianensis]|uniref:tRNA-dihydrouridine(20/20a) synthase n=1 Tax=Thioclava dalianensis TaxID=1185766 RepID=A0A074TIW2_9RHOB|nr:tRNA dihydrouridine(20/20a) synthase DusA [Thioclava dalianensis]KEP70100.1 tRNA-dihydrouridine synthase A [Thioclava dalianensis]SFN51139.1 tRNA-dihydrouridine synthase A [Thioclava dalianensis]
MPSPLETAARLSVAPMMDWTDRHCRAFHRAISRHALLYTEMVTAPAVIRGDRLKLLGFDASEHPVALQLGGSDPRELAQAATIGADWGYKEINLNCGCPSDRVQSGAFGAVLMKSPDLVAECVAEMIAAQPLPVTVKCRIGVDDQSPAEVLPDFLEKIARAGVTRVTIHARKAWLKGLSPKDNREIPPLDYPLVHAMKAQFPQLHLSINGGIGTLEAAQAELAAGLDGVMVGRAAYHQPMAVLGAADAQIFGDGAPVDPFTVAEAMKPHIAHHIESGGRLHQVTRHMLGLFHGRPGARRFRQILSEGATREGAGLELYESALSALCEQAN